MYKEMMLQWTCLSLIQITVMMTVELSMWQVKTVNCTIPTSQITLPEMMVVQSTGQVMVVTYITSPVSITMQSVLQAHPMVVHSVL